MPVLAAYFLFAFVASLLLTRLCRAAALRTGRVARPRADRWHSQPTAMLGGIAIAVVTLSTVVVIRPIEPLWVVAGTGALIFAVGLTDDFIRLKPYTKLIAQITIASAIVFFGHRMEVFESRTLNALVTLAWIVGITNAVNLLDNMDGLCGGIAFIAGFTLLVGLPIEQATPQALYLAAMLGATAGFLVYNVHPASIFMGDSGSLFLGLTLATMTIELSRHTKPSTVVPAFAGPVLVMLIPIFDTLLVTVSRWLSGRSPSQGGTDHSSHRLVAIGLPERTAVAVLWVLAAAGAFTGKLLIDRGLAWGALSVALLALSMALFAVFLWNIRVYQGEDLRLLRSGKVTPFVVDFMHKRRVAEVLLDCCLVAVAYYAAYRLRFEEGGEEFRRHFESFLTSLPLVLAIQLMTFYAVGLYRGMWRYFGLMDGVVVAKGVFLGTITISFLLLYLYRFENYARTIFVIYAALLMLLLTGSRASFRLMREFVRRRRLGRRVVIYGAGHAGSLAVRELTHDERNPVRVLGFVDDDSGKHRSRVEGYPVLGGFASLEALITNNAVEQVVVSARLIDARQLASLERLCAENGVELFRLQFNLERMTSAS